MQYKSLQDSHDLTVLPVISYIYCVDEFMRPAFYRILQRVLYRAQTDLKCKTGFRENIYNRHFIIYGELVHSPF
jgi:hypothetical protein